MKKFIVVTMVCCLVVVFGACVWAADFPGQKLTADELASGTGMGFSIPASLFSMTACAVIVNGQTQTTQVTPTSSGYSFATGPLTFNNSAGAVTVAAGATFRK